MTDINTKNKNSQVTHNQLDSSLVKQKRVITSVDELLTSLGRDPKKEKPLSKGMQQLSAMMGSTDAAIMNTGGEYGKSNYDENMVVARDVDFDNLEESIEGQRDYYRQQDVDKGLDVTAFILAIIAIFLILAIVIRKIANSNNGQSVNYSDSQTIHSFSNVFNDKSDNNFEIKDNSLITDFTIKYINVRRSFRIPEEKVFAILNLSRSIIESRSFINIPNAYIKEISGQFANNSIMQIFSILYFEAKLTDDVFFIENKKIIYDSIRLTYENEMGALFLDEDFNNDFAKLDQILDQVF